MSILFVSSDLMFSSRVGGVARQQGVEFRMIGGDQAADRIASESPRLIFVDLAAAGCDIESICQAAATIDPQPPVVAYASHVMESRLAEARDAGCDEVLSRGQFDRSFSQLVARHASE